MYIPDILANNNAYLPIAGIGFANKEFEKETSYRKATFYSNKNTIFDLSNASQSPSYIIEEYNHHLNMND